MSIQSKKFLFCMVLFSLSMLPAQSFSVDNDERIMEMANDYLWKNDVQGAMEVLSQKIKENPRAVKLLKMRAELFSAQGNIEASQRDIESVLALEPNNMEYLSARCFLKEVAGAAPDVYLACYRDVVGKMRKAYPEAYLEGDMKYVLTLLRAELPEADAIRQRYLNTLGNEPHEKYFRESVLKFDRHEAVRLYKAMRQR